MIPQNFLLKHSHCKIKTFLVFYHFLQFLSKSLWLLCSTQRAAPALNQGKAQMNLLKKILKNIRIKTIFIGQAFDQKWRARKLVSKNIFVLFFCGHKKFAFSKILHDFFWKPKRTDFVVMALAKTIKFCYVNQFDIYQYIMKIRRHILSFEICLYFCHF